MIEESTRIRLVSPEDADALAAIVSESADHLRPWEPLRDASFYTTEGQRERIESALVAAENGTSAPFVIE